MKSMLMRRRIPVTLVAGVALLLGSFAPGVEAHTGHPTLTITSTDPRGVTAPASFAVCDPAPGEACNTDAKSPNEEPLGPRLVDIALHGFSPNTTVHLWWLKGEMANAVRTDCRPAVTGIVDPNARTHLKDASNTNNDDLELTTDSNGNATGKASLPPGNQGQQWEYGPNWVCGTTSTHNGAPPAGTSGQIADRMFTIYPG